MESALQLRASNVAPAHPSASGDSAVRQFIRRANEAPRLTREEEEALVRSWREGGDEVAKEELVRCHLRYVVSIAMKHRRYGLPLGDLFSEGSFGLVRALERFDPALGHRFVTYAAYWIRAYVLSYVLNHWSLVGVGVRSKHFFRLRRERSRIESLVGEGAAARTMLAERTGIPEERLEGMLRRLDARDVSLDARPFADANVTIGDQLPANELLQDDDLDRRATDACAKHLVREAMTSLDPRERLVIEQRLLADEDEGRTLADLGRELGISRERARQLEARGKEKLRVRIAELARSGKCGECAGLVSAA